MASSIASWSYLGVETVAQLRWRGLFRALLFGGGLMGTAMACTVSPANNPDSSHQELALADDSLSKNIPNAKEQTKGGRTHKRWSPSDGTAVGEVTATNALFWSRSEQGGHLIVAFRPCHAKSEAAKIWRFEQEFSDPSADNTVHLKLRSLSPDLEYETYAWFQNSAEESLIPQMDWRPPVEAVRARFRTAPRKQVDKALRFAWSGDLGGQNFCRDASEGYPIFSQLGAERLDFFLALGDMIYGDNICTAVGPTGNQQIPREQEIASRREDYWQHWKYNRADYGYRELLSNTSVISIWDDHEVVNDFGPKFDRRDPARLPELDLISEGRAALFDYNPIAKGVSGEMKLYRSFRWGKNAEIFVLDTRSYRDGNNQADSENAPKTMLGKEQKEWLIRSYLASRASWKIIVSSVPLAQASGPDIHTRDGWSAEDYASGYGFELLEILGRFRDAGEDGGIWLSADIHSVVGYEHRPFQDAPEFSLIELISGPLSAYPFNNHGPIFPERSDMLYRYPEEGRPGVKTYAHQRKLMTYSVMEIDDEFSARIVTINADGDRVTELSLERDRDTGRVVYQNAYSKAKYRADSADRSIVTEPIAPILENSKSSELDAKKLRDE